MKFSEVFIDNARVIEETVKRYLFLDEKEKTHPTHCYSWFCEPKLKITCIDEKFLSHSLLENKSTAAGHPNENQYLYVVRDKQMKEVKVNRVAKCIYPCNYLHPGMDYPADEFGSSETIGQALGREYMEDVSHVVLHRSGHEYDRKERYYNEVTVAENPEYRAKKTPDEK